MSTPKKHLPSVARRIRAGEMLMAGETIESVVQQLGISTPSAKRYKALLEEGGLAALENISVGGRKSVLDPTAFDWIAEALRGSPAAFGFETGRWTDGRLQQVIYKQFGVNFSRVYTRRIMIDLGFG
jgi:transposase